MLTFTKESAKTSQVMTRQRLEQAKARLKEKGWSHRSAARELGVSFEHLNRVLNGHRESKSLLIRIGGLLPRPSKTKAKATA